jgi:hypothetical protein
MKVGDFVMFSDIDSPYAKWFYGRCGTVMSVRTPHCRIEWQSPVLYYDKHTQSSDFLVSNFTVI